MSLNFRGKSLRGHLSTITYPSTPGSWRKVFNDFLVNASERAFIDESAVDVGNLNSWDQIEIEKFLLSNTHTQ